MMQKGTIIGFRIAHPRVEALPGPDSGICPPGSECARYAIWRVQEQLRASGRTAFVVARERAGEIMRARGKESG